MRSNVDHWLVALDIGATKTHMVIEAVGGRRVVDVKEPSLDWQAEPAASAANWIAARIEARLPVGGTIAGVAVGAQGVNRSDTATTLERALAERGYPARAVNDAMLVIPAAGLATGIGVIAGTGAIGVGVDANGTFLAAGGWGWIIGDEGSAAGLVREAVRSALRANDEGRPDDGLLAALLEDFDVADAERLTRRVNDEATVENWAPHAAAVFAAAAAGSGLAAGVIADGADHLADLVTQLRGRGAVGYDVVVAGSVILNQARLLDAFRRNLAASHPSFKVHALLDPPVEGAVRLARALAARPK